MFWQARYRPYPMVILSGILLAMAFPPLPFAFLAYVGFIPLLFVIDETPEKVFEDQFWGSMKAVVVVFFRMITLQFIWRFKEKPWKYQRKIISHYAQVFRYSYTTFVIWNLGVSYWLMMTAFRAESVSEIITYLSAGLVANLVNPFLMSMPVYFYARLRFTGWRKLAPWALVVFWLSFEWLHFNWDLSWSWLTLGHALSKYPMAIQYLEFTGILGASLHILAGNVLLYLVLKNWKEAKKSIVIVSASAWAILMAAPFIANFWILNSDRPVFQAVGQLNVRVLQPNIDPYDKFQGGTRVRQVAQFEQLIEQEGIDSIQLVVMPETCLPDYYFANELRRKPLLEPLWKSIYSHNYEILTGFMELRYFPPGTTLPSSAFRHYGDGYFDVCNASALLSQKDELPQTFQKAKLVPMVERMPFLDYLGFLNSFNLDLAGALGGYGLPDSVRNLILNDNIPVASLVCYESEYGDYARQFVKKGAQVMTVVTNDGWWGNTSGHVQHAHFATLRAIENRRDIARSANTGTSLFADSRGAIYQPTKWWVPTTIDRKLNLYSSQTYYTKHGDYLGWISFGAALVLILITQVAHWVADFRKKKASASE